MASQKERGARERHKRLLYCVNVNRTSLDHLLLGKKADVDKMSSGLSIARGNLRARIFQSSRRPKPLISQRGIQSGVGCRHCAGRKGIELAGDLLGFELAVKGFEDPVLEDIAIAGLDFSKEEAQAGWPGVKDYSFRFEGFAGIVNFQEHLAFFRKGRGGFEKAALQAQFGDTSWDDRFRRAFGSDFGGCVERKS